MGLKLSNNAASRLASSLSNSATSITLQTGEGALFPSLSSGEWFPLTIYTSSQFEIVKVTGRSSDTLTVERGQEGTTAAAFAAGARVELRLTSSAMAEMILPPGTGPMPWSLPTEPPGWIFCDGRTLLSSTAYGTLRTAYINAGFPFGDDGSGNPKIPDMRGRVPAGLDNMGGSAANRITAGGSGIAGTTLGATGGAETHTLTAAQMPRHTHTATAASAGSHSHGGSTDTEAAHTHGITVASAGSGGAHPNIQPTIVLNWILKT